MEWKTFSELILLSGSSLWSEGMSIVWMRFLVVVCSAVIIRRKIEIHFSHFLLSILEKTVRKRQCLMINTEIYFNLLAKPVSYM